MTRAQAGEAVRLRADAERRLTPEAVREYLAVPVSEDERAETLALVRWFRRRYAHPLDRLAYVRRATRRWQRFVP